MAFRGCTGSKKTAESPIRGIIRSKRAAELAITGGISSIWLPSDENIVKCKEHARNIRRHKQPKRNGIGIDKLQRQLKDNGIANQRHHKKQERRRIGNERRHKQHKASKSRKRSKMQGTCKEYKAA